MSSKNGRGAAQAKTDWEDKFWRLKTEYDDLQAVCNKQTDEIRK